MKKLLYSIGFLLAPGCSHAPVEPTLQLRISNATDRDFNRVRSIYESGAPLPVVIDFGAVKSKSLSRYVPELGPYTTLCNDTEVELSDRVVRRPKDADCRIISFTDPVPGKYTLIISQLTDKGFEVAIKKD